MLGAFLPALFFPFITWRMARNLARAWPMNQEEFRRTMGYTYQIRWRRRVAMAAPGVVAVGVVVSVLSVLIALAQLTHDAALVYLTLGVAGVVLLCAAATTSAWLWGVPKVWLLPAFRRPGAFGDELKR